MLDKLEIARGTMLT